MHWGFPCSQLEVLQNLYPININVKPIIQHNLVFIIPSHLHIKTCNRSVTWKAANKTFIFSLSFGLSLELNFWKDLHLFLRLLSLLTTNQNFSPQRHQTASCLPDVQFFLGLFLPHHAPNTNVLTRKLLS